MQPNYVDVQHDEAIEKIKTGIDRVADLVKITLGPRGKYVSLYNGANLYPTVTNDGVTIAKRLRFENPYEDMGAQVIQEASSKTADHAGDGTTTAAILVQALVNEALTALEGGALSRVELTNQLKTHAKAVIAAASKEKRDITDAAMLAQVATISSRDEKVGTVVADLVHALGGDSYVTIEDFPVEGLIPERTVGMKVRSMPISPFFYTDRKTQEASLTDVHILVTDQPLTQPADEVLRIMQTVAENFKQKQAVIIAPSFGDLAMRVIYDNWQAGTFKLLPVQVTVYGATGEGYVRDIAAVTGGQFISTRDNLTLPEIKAEHFGVAGKLVCHDDGLYISDGEGDIEARIAEVKAQLPHLKDFEATAARERIAKMKHQLGTIKVGADTDSARETRKYLVEDAINATRAAMRDGIIVGGGATLYRAAAILDSRDLAQSVLKKACSAPLMQIAKNSEVAMTIGTLEAISSTPGKTVDFLSGKVVDGFKDGIIDPFAVLEQTLTNAVAQACNFILTGAAVVPVFTEEG